MIKELKKATVEKLKSLRVEELKSGYNEQSSIINSSPLHRFISSTKANGFTMAEILLSLTIIGVVAAITLPSLTGNINERTWNTQRKALYSRMSQAIALMPSLNGYGTLAEGDPNDVAQTFVTSGLAKVLKINNICDKTHLSDCGLPDKITPYSGDALVFPKKLSELNSVLAAGGTYTTDEGSVVSDPRTPTDTHVAAFETGNGESIAVYYNPICAPRQFGQYFAQSLMCANFIYDLNGKKGPNSFGKDIGYITAMYPADPVVVAPMPVPMSVVNKAYDEAGAACKNIDEDYRLPNAEELSAMFYNKLLLNSDNSSNPSKGAYWSSSVSTAGSAMENTVQHFGGGMRYTAGEGKTFYVHCIRR